MTYRIHTLLVYTGPDFLSEAASFFEDDPLVLVITCISPGIARLSVGDCTPDFIIYCDGKGVECIRFLNDTRNDGVTALSNAISERETDHPVAPGAGSERVTTGGENIVEDAISST